LMIPVPEKFNTFNTFNTFTTFDPLPPASAMSTPPPASRRRDGN
jgi:hypothetical protein